jgi:hypothetical protein
MVLLLAAALSNGVPHLKEYLRDPIGIYDDKGELVRKAPKKELPKPPFDVTAQEDFFVFEVDGKKLFVRSADVLVEGRASRCAPVLAAAQSPSRRTAATDIGVKSGMGTADVPCTH